MGPWTGQTTRVMQLPYLELIPVLKVQEGGEAPQHQQVVQSTRKVFCVCPLVAEENLDNKGG